MAWVEKAPSGKYRGAYRDPAGHVRRKSFTGKSAARSWAEEQEELARRGQWRDPKLGRITVAEWSAQWMAARVVAASTAAGDRYRMARILEEWGDRPVEHLTTIGLQGWVRRLSADMAPATVVKHTTLLASMLKAAVRERIITSNPAEYLQLPTVAGGREVFLTHDEVDAIAEHLDEPYRTIFLVLADTGLRWGELVGLHVGRVNFLRRAITVQAVVTEVGGEFALKDYPKTRRSRRDVPIEDRTIDLLAAHLARDPARPCGLVHTERDACTGLVFRHPDGGLLSRHTMPRLLRAAAAEAGVTRHFRTHDLRHTAASWLVQDGVPLYDVQRYLGHESFATTQKYAHHAPGQDDRVRAALSARSGSKTGSKILEPGRT